MLPLRYARRWRAASLLLLCVVLVATLIPTAWLWSDRVRLGSWLGNFDKWSHLATFLLLAVWFSGQYRPRSYWRIAIGLLVFGLFIELCQQAVGYRTADTFDVLANLAGIIIGLVVAAAGAGGWSMRVESWLARRNT